MNTRYSFGLPIAVLCAAVTSGAPRMDEPPALPPTPAAVLELVSFRTFSLERGYTHLWRKEQPKVDSGFLLVLRVDPALVYPRQVGEPVLYVGNQTAERVNIGYESAHVVAIVPAVLDDPTKRGFVDLSRVPIWFGSAELPERVGAKRIAMERSRAERAGIRPTSAPDLLRASDKDGPAFVGDDKLHLLREAAALVERYAPQEAELVE